jgi:diguanylate cyclase (GGDEF)-like protein
VLEDKAVGVLTLRNRLARHGFKAHDMRLMQIFCDYLSTSIQNLLDFFYQKELALRDHLTGLRNDRFFYRQLIAEIEGCERFGGHLSLVFIDLDHFKNVVDSHGHLVGSQVIAQVGQLLGRIVEHPGATLARYGGDEYVVVLPGLDHQQAAEIAEHVRQKIVEGIYMTEPLADGSPPLNLKDCFTASLGVASYRDCAISGTSFDAKRHAFIRKADEAMYRAKAAGKNQVYIHKGDLQ